MIKNVDFLKQKAYALIFWRTPVGEVLSKTYDIYYHLKFGFNDNKLPNKANLEFYLTKQYHIVEKGLTLPSPRPGFGADKIKLLLDKGNLYIQKYGTSQLTSSIAQCLIDYLAFNDRIDYTIDTKIRKDIDTFVAENDLNSRGGAKQVTKDNVKSLAKQPFNEFVKSRFSIRDFSDIDVPITTINDSIDLAKFAPSVCNRQSWQVHYYNDKTLMKELLTIQNGNGGFTDCINGLMIITGDLKGFTKYESNQLFVDGGLFSMNIMLALHYYNIGSCPLNTCVPFVVENKIKELADIPKNERLIMMLAVGNLKEEFRVAVSERRSTDSILSIH